MALHPAAALLLTVTLSLTPGVRPARAASGGWTRQFGTAEADEALGVALAGNDDAYVVGWTAGQLPGQVSSGTVDAFVQGYDAAGNARWARQFGSWDQDVARDVAVDRSGDVYVVGETSGTLPGQQTSGSRDAFVRKYDAEGREVWTRQFGGAGGEGAWGVALDRAGDVYVVGSTLDALPGLRSAGGFDAFIRRYDPSGQERWTRQFGGGHSDGARSVAVDEAGWVWVVGSTESALPGQVSEGAFDAFVRLYDQTGTATWTEQFGTGADDFGMDVAADPTGGVSIVGTTDRALPGQRSAGGTDAFVRSYGAGGTIRWTEQFGTGRTDDAWSVAVDPVGNTYVTGIDEQSLPLGGGSNGNAYVRKYRPDGRELRRQGFGSDAEDGAYGSAVDGTGSSYVVGSTWGSLPGGRSSGRRDAFAVKLS